MNFHTLSAIFNDTWFIRPAYARTALPLVTEAIKAHAAYDASAPYKGRLETSTIPVFNPKRRNFTAVTAEVYSVGPYTATDRLPFNSIAMVDFLGPVLKYGDACTYGSVEYNELISSLASNSRIAGIIMNIDSPGGQADGTAMLAQTIKDASQQKPVLGIIQDGIAASAGYWVASACQEIYCTQQTDQVGSIGAYTTLLDFTGYLEQMGIKEIDIYAPQSTDKNKDYKDAIAGDTTLIQENLEFLVNDFINTIKTNRGGRLNAKNGNPFTGKMYNAADAQKIGLIDGIKPIAGVVQRMQNLIKMRQAA